MKYKDCSLNDRRWLKQPPLMLNKEASSSKYSTTFQKILQRKLSEGTDAENFLHPQLSNLHDPLLLKDMKKAVERILLAVENKEPIWIYGDYDVDGITSVSLLLKTFKQMNYPVNYYIPDRHEEGYGLNLSAVESLAELGCKVLITVDCGITSVKEALRSKELGIDMIITDHHECQSEIPQAFAVINPKQEDCRYPFKMLAGVGIAYKMASALLGEWILPIQSELCELAAFGTIADIAPLTDENRILAKYGLEALSETNSIGFKALINCSDLNNKKITAGHVGFMLAPKINAAGRIDDPKLGVVLLTTNDPEEAHDISQLLKETNDRRQQLEKEILEAAIYQLDNSPTLKEDKISIAYGEGWNSGVIGIVASRLVEKYHKPAIVFSIIDGKAKGSARSIDGFDIFEALCTLTDLYDKFGGHEQAAGLTIPLENFSVFEEKLKTYCHEKIAPHLLIPAYKIDEVLESSELSYGFLDELLKLEPYGMGNSKPIFKLEGVQIQKKVLLGKNKEFTKFEVADGIRTFEAISFDKSGYYNYYKPGDLIDLVCHVELNEFKGTQTIQLLLKDIRGYRNELVKLQTPIQLFSRAYSIRLAALANQARPVDKDQWNFNNAEPLKDNQGLSPIWTVDSLEGLFYFYNRLYDDYQGRLQLHLAALALDPLERERFTNEERVHLVLCPIEAHLEGLTYQTVEGYFDLQPQKPSNQLVASWIPDRSELIDFYKKIRGGEFDETLPADVLTWLCTMILEEAKLLAIHENHLALEPTPENKVDLMEIGIYKMLQSLKTSIKNL